MSNNAARKIGLVRSMKTTLIMKLCTYLAYTETINPPKEAMMLQRHRLLLHHLGDKSYCAALPELLPQPKIINEDAYCVVCPGASKIEKCWPTERFVEIIDYITEKYQMNVHLCGGVDESPFEKLILAQSKNPGQLISHIGKTTFSEWSSIVQHAAIVIGNDSATMHLAAASRRQAICIAGVYDKYQFFPYKTDVLNEGDVLPVTVFKDMSCEWCRTIGYYAGFGNSECAKRLSENKCALCIDAITVNEVKCEIDHLMETKNT